MTTSAVVPEVGTVLSNPVAGTTIVFRATAASSGGALVELEAHYPPHSAPPPSHLHPEQDEHFTVLTGRLRAVVDGREHDLGPGEVLEVPRGTPHLMWNDTDGPTSIAWRTFPALATDQMQADLWAVSRDNGWEPSPLQRFEVVQRYPREFCLC